MENNLKIFTLDEVKDKLIGNRGTTKRELYEQDLQMELLGSTLKKIRLERNLTQEQLGKLIGVQKSQISKLENNATNVTIHTILKVFIALKARISFRVEMLNRQAQIG